MLSHFRSDQVDPLLDAELSALRDCIVETICPPQRSSSSIFFGGNPGGNAYSENSFLLKKADEGYYRLYFEVPSGHTIYHEQLLKVTAYVQHELSVLLTQVFVFARGVLGKEQESVLLCFEVVPLYLQDRVHVSVHSPPPLPVYSRMTTPKTEGRSPIEYATNAFVQIAQRLDGNNDTSLLVRLDGIRYEGPHRQIASVSGYQVLSLSQLNVLLHVNPLFVHSICVEENPEDKSLRIKAVLEDTTASQGTVWIQDFRFILSHLKRDFLQ